MYHANHSSPLSWPHPTAVLPTSLAQRGPVSHLRDRHPARNQIMQMQTTHSFKPKTPRRYKKLDRTTLFLLLRDGWRLRVSSFMVLEENRGRTHQQCCLPSTSDCMLCCIVTQLHQISVDTLTPPAIDSSHNSKSLGYAGQVRF